jgi:hypothetical protein
MSYRKFDWNRARSDFSTLFTDFFTYATGDWVLTTIEAGAGSATEALGDMPGGVLVVTNDTASADRDCFQWAGGAGAVKETFALTAGKKLQFVARFKVDDAELAAVMIGLHVTDTEPLGGVTDGIYFRSAGDTEAINFVVEKGSAETVVAAGKLTDDTYTEIEFYYDGADSIMAYRDGRRVGSVKLADGPTTELALSFAVQNGSAVARVMHIDYIGASQQR